MECCITTDVYRLRVCVKEFSSAQPNVVATQRVDNWCSSSHTGQFNVCLLTTNFTKLSNPFNTRCGVQMWHSLIFWLHLFGYTGYVYLAWCCLLPSVVRVLALMFSGSMHCVHFTVSHHVVASMWSSGGGQWLPRHVCNPFCSAITFVNVPAPVYAPLQRSLPALVCGTYQH